MYQPEPEQTWKRMFFPPLAATLPSHQYAEKHTNRDLAKPIEQLLCDIHDMAQSGTGGDMGNYPVQAVLHVQKHMASMMAKVALSNERAAKASDKLQHQVYWL